MVNSMNSTSKRLIDAARRHDRSGHLQAAAHPGLYYLLRTQSRCSYRRLSSVGFQFRQGAGEPNLASQLPQPSVGSRCRNQLQSGANGLGDTCTAGFLCSFEELGGNLYGDFAGCFHIGFLLYRTQYQHEIWCNRTRRTGNFYTDGGGSERSTRNRTPIGDKRLFLLNKKMRPSKGRPHKT